MKSRRGADRPQQRGEEERFLRAQVDRLLASMERMRFEEYLKYVDNRPRQVFNSFLLGLARGVGTAVGFTVLGAVLVMILQNLARRNLPLIGGFLAELARLVLERL